MQIILIILTFLISLNIVFKSVGNIFTSVNTFEFFNAFAIDIASYMNVAVIKLNFGFKKNYYLLKDTVNVQNLTRAITGPNQLEKVKQKNS